MEIKFKAKDVIKKRVSAHGMNRENGRVLTPKAWIDKTVAIVLLEED